MKNTITYVVLLLILLGIIGFIISKTWTLGSDSDDWKAVCVKGQTVYRANFAQKAMAVNALNKSGNPVPCKSTSES